jgi:hypothetical protein
MSCGVDGWLETLRAGGKLDEEQISAMFAQLS